jgi:hypothetical protein
MGDGDLQRSRVGVDPLGNRFGLGNRLGLAVAWLLNSDRKLGRTHELPASPLLRQPLSHVHATLGQGAHLTESSLDASDHMQWLEPPRHPPFSGTNRSATPLLQ